jgi:hypothetical protein
MAITYSWNFTTFEKALLADGLLDVVKVIHWSIGATDGTYSSSVYGTASLAAPDPDNYVAYEDITKQWAIDVVSQVGRRSGYGGVVGSGNRPSKEPTYREFSAAVL